MIDKKMKGGRTHRGAVATFNYLLNQRVEEGTAKVLKGDPEITLNLIKEASKKQKWSWSSGVLSFSEKLSEETLREIIEEHEKVTFAGMSPGQYNITYILHIDKDRSELHYMIPRIELSTGKAMNPYFVKRDFKKKDIFQEYINQKYNLTSFLDNQVLTKDNKIAEKWPVGQKDEKWNSLKKKIDAYFQKGVRNGKFTSRDQIIEKLREQGYELSNNPGKSMISILDKDGNSRRLKGVIYSKDFKEGVGVEMLKVNRPKTKKKPKGTRDLKKLTKALEQIIEKQAYGNREKYGFEKEKATAPQNQKEIVLDRPVNRKEEDERIGRERKT